MKGLPQNWAISELGFFKCFFMIHFEEYQSTTERAEQGLNHLRAILVLQVAAAATYIMKFLIVEARQKAIATQHSLVLLSALYGFVERC